MAGVLRTFTRFFRKCFGKGWFYGMTTLAFGLASQVQAKNCCNFELSLKIEKTKVKYGIQVSINTWHVRISQKYYNQLLYLDLPFQGCLRLGLSWFNWWVSFAPEFLCCYFCESSCLFYLSFNFDFYVSKIMHLWVRNLPRKPNNYVSEEPRQN